MSNTNTENKSVSENSTQVEGSLSYMIQKLEKISNALYILTNFFPQTEPLRVSLREKALHLVSLAFSLRTYSSNETSLSSNITNVLDEVSSLLSIAKRSGLISDINASIIIEECGRVASFGQEQGLIVGPYLSRDHFDVSMNIASLPQTKHAPVLSSSLSKEGQAFKPISDAKSTSVHIPESATPKQSSDNTKKERPEEVSGLKKRRRDAILSFIKDKGEVGIKEISREVRGCSQKTIQRELVELVDQGVINRRGERRWSLYSLAKSSV